MAKIVGSRWVTWRVSFADSSEMIPQLSFTPEIANMFVTKADEITNENGVFQMHNALRQMGAER